MEIDVFIPIGPNDYSIAHDSILNKRKFVEGVRNIYYYAEDDLALDGAQKVSPKDQGEILRILQSTELRKDRVGWVLQQIVVLSIFNFIEDLTDNVLVICCDVFLNTKMSFVKNGIPVLMLGRSNVHDKFSTLIERSYRDAVLTQYCKRFSAISHHSVLSRQYLKSFYSRFGSTPSALTESLIPHMDLRDKSPISEYQLYFAHLLNSKLPFYLRESVYVDASSRSASHFKRCPMVAEHWYLRHAGQSNVLKRVYWSLISSLVWLLSARPTLITKASDIDASYFLRSDMQPSRLIGVALVFTSFRRRFSNVSKALRFHN